jgi:endonuclease/exonuclease/phosphatase family metal-dependent hydrolase
MRARAAAILFAAVSAAAPCAFGQLRVVTLNGANTLNTGGTTAPRTPWMNTILSAIGSSVSDDPYLTGNSGITRPIDVLALQEVNSAATTVAGYASLMNTLYPGANYQYATLNGNYTDPQPSTQGLVYNANAVTLVSQSTVGVASSSGQPRQTLKYQLRPIGYDAAADIYIYNSHYKSGASDTARRNTEAQAIRGNADAMPIGRNIIYLGDFNVYDSNEPMYNTLIGSGSGQAFDPINKPGTWNNNSTFRRAHTQSPFSSSTANSLNTGFDGVAGGMDDRFDFQLVSSGVMDGHGLAYIPNSYQAFANNGSHALNSAINVSNTAQPQNVLDALAGVLDHLPVLADYQLPAKLSAGVSAAPGMVIAGANVQLNVTVSNAAPVSLVKGADTLDYTVVGTGSVDGGSIGSDQALGGSNVHTVSLITTSAGAKSGAVQVTSTSQQVANNNFSQNINFTVLDHAQPSFAAGANQTSATVDFGYVPVGSSPRTLPFSIYDRTATPGFTAALAVNSINNSGDTAWLTTDATTLVDLPAGTSASYNAQLNSAVAGNFSAMHQFATADQNLPGATAQATLALTSTARVFSVASFPVSGYMFLPASEPLTTGSWSIASGVTLTKTGPGSLTINGPQSNGAGSALAIAGGDVTFNSDAGPSAAMLSISAASGSSVHFNATQHLASLELAGGIANVGDHGGRVVVTNSFSTSGGGTIDLRDNNMIVRGGAIGSWNGSVYTGITGNVQAGRGDGTWNGDGIVTSMSDATSSVLTTLAVAGADELGLAGDTWAGESVSNGDVLVMYTWGGDADLNGELNGDDYFFIDSHVLQSGGVFGFHQGDFDLNGEINGDDYFIIDSNILAAQSSPPLGRLAAIPEPCVGLIVTPAMVASLRRRRGRAPVRPI